ncbi:hypothetical protein ACFSJH_16200 [Paenibacillus yanchengensis]|uniref:Uncharacterized protein n=1 Tax=Paenibacillus yanchengensis TaxID=2035833 RepID=A0ABW4YP18_9BACL
MIMDSSLQLNWISPHDAPVFTSSSALIACVDENWLLTGIAKSKVYFM